MTTKDRVPDLETAARYIFRRDHIFANNSAVKPAALIPYCHVEASVTLHEGREEDAIWANGLQTADQRTLPLIARADIPVSKVRSCVKMDVVRDPIEDDVHPERNNPHHAEIVGWSAEKAEQKNVAISILSGIKAKFYQRSVSEASVQSGLTKNISERNNPHV